MTFTKTLLSWVAPFLAAWTVGFLIHAKLPAADVQWTTVLYHEKVMALEALDARDDRTRVIFLGGSGTHFGVLAQDVTEILQLKTFNAGLHAGLGLNALVDGYVNLLRRGDVVVLIPEYESLSSSDGDGRMSTPFRVRNLADLPLTTGGLEQSVRMTLGSGAPGLKGLLRGLALNVFSFRGAEPYSTNISPHGDASILPAQHLLPRDNRIGVVSAAVLESLRAASQRFDKVGVRLVFALPWTQVSERSPMLMETVRANARALGRIAPVLFDAETLNLQTDPALFADSAYHLSASGRSFRSAAVARQLSPLLERERAAR